jgi:hypothetical protein
MANSSVSFHVHRILYLAYVKRKKQHEDLKQFGVEWLTSAVDCLANSESNIEPLYGDSA